MRISDIIRNVGRRLGLDVKAPVSIPQTKEAIAERYNRNIDRLAGLGWTPEKLPPKINSEWLESYTSAELKHVVGAVNKAQGSYSSPNGYSTSQAAKAYEDAMLDVINARRAKISNAIAETNATYKNEPTGLKRGEMGDVRAEDFTPLKRDRVFKNALEQARYRESLQKAGTNYKMEIYKQNIMLSLYKQYGDEALEIIAMIKNAKAEKVLKAYYTEEMFSIGNIYEESEHGDLLSILREALEKQRIKPVGYDDNEMAALKSEMVDAVQASEQRKLLRERMLGRA